eukprot:COSAG03_NODE_1347_length_4282_cov_5.739661_3_plen_38_part_00
MSGVLSYMYQGNKMRSTATHPEESKKKKPASSGSFAC